MSHHHPVPHPAIQSEPKFLKSSIISSGWFFETSSNCVFTLAVPQSVHHSHLIILDSHHSIKGSQSPDFNSVS